MAFTHFYEPQCIEEASSILIEHGKRAACLAGGTSLIQRRFGSIEHIVSLAKLGLGNIEGKTIGAMATLSELVEHEADLKATKILQQAAQSAASAFLRNKATVGGSALICFRWSDLVAPLLALNAVFRLQSIGGERKLFATELYGNCNPLRKIEPGEILTDISLPENITAYSFTKYGMTRFCHAIWDVAVVKVACHYRVAISAGTTFPVRLPRVESLLSDAPVDIEDLRKAIDESVNNEEMRVTASSGYPLAYRLEVLPVIIMDTIKKMGEAGAKS